MALGFEDKLHQHIFPINILHLDLQSLKNKRFFNYIFWVENDINENIVKRNENYVKIKTLYREMK